MEWLDSEFTIENFAGYLKYDPSSEFVLFSFNFTIDLHCLSLKFVLFRFV